MSTREGNVIKVEDLLKESIERVEHIIEEKNPEMEILDPCDSVITPAFSRIFSTSSILSV